MNDLLVCYDVRSNRRRRRLFKSLHHWGHPVQKSVFHCRVKGGGRAALRRKAERQIDFETDSVLYIPLCPKCRERIEQSGRPVEFDSGDSRIL